MATLGSHEDIIIVGAGIIGLDVALALAERGFGDRITVIAEHLPGDTSPAFTSPWAGCNFSAISGRDKNALRWDKMGYHLWKLASQDPSQTFVRRTPSVEYWDDEVPHEKIKDMADYLQDFEVISQDKLPHDTKFGVSFTTLTVNAPSHLIYLYQRLQQQYGVRFVRQKIANLHDPFSNPRTRIVFNCVGNAAKTLAGAPHVHTNVTRHGLDYETYIIPRPESNGNVILGGYMQKGNDDGSTYSEESKSILDRTKGLSSELAAGNIEILAAFSGLHPSRDGGARIERSDVNVAGSQRIVVHNYGAGGTGFQAGYGMVTDAVATVDDVLERCRSRS